MPLAPLQACIFDMDGVLLDSEPFWRQAEIEVFATVGLDLTEQDCMETMGVRIDEVVALRHSQKPWSSPSCPNVAEQIVERVAELIQTRGRPLEGVHEALEFLQGKGLPLALASSSSSRLIRATLDALDLTGAFPVWHSAEHEEFGKPHPAVFLATARKLGVAPASCLAIEDSLNGVVAAFAARMPVLAVPEPAVAGDPRFALAQAVLGSLRELPEAWERLVG